MIFENKYFLSPLEAIEADDVVLEILKTRVCALDEKQMRLKAKTRVFFGLKINTILPKHGVDVYRVLFGRRFQAAVPKRLWKLREFTFRKIGVKSVQTT